MQRSQAFRANSIQDLADQINQFFIANAGFVGVSLSVTNVGAGFQAIVMYTP